MASAAENIIVLHTYYNPLDAHLARTRLEAAGVACFLSNESLALLNRMYSPASGGVRLHVYARDAARADAAATLIANAVDLPGHPAIRRVPARALDPDSDLGDRPVTVSVGALTPGEVAAALAAGLRRAEAMRAEGLIADAALALRGETVVTGRGRLAARADGRRTFGNPLRTQQEVP